MHVALTTSPSREPKQQLRSAYEEIAIDQPGKFSSQSYALRRVVPSNEAAAF